MNQSTKELLAASSNRVNQKFADSFFRKIFEKKEAIEELLCYVGESIKAEESIQVITQNPVLIGNRKNDLSFLVNQTFYYFFEQQSTENENIPIRLLFYVSFALERYLNGKNLFRKSLLKIPEVKCFVIFTGIAEKQPAQLQMTQRLSDAYLSKKEKKEFDLELCVHGFQMRVTEEEIETFLKENKIPLRFKEIENIVVQYAMFVNTVKYQLKKEEVEINTEKAKELVLKSCELFLERGYLTAYFTNQEVIDMAVEQLSYEEIIRFQEREEGREEGEKEKLKKQVRKKLEKGKIVEVIADESEDDIDTIWKIMIEIKKEKNS